VIAEAGSTNHVTWLTFLALFVPFALLFCTWLTNGLVQSSAERGVYTDEQLRRWERICRTCRRLAVIVPIVCVALIVVWQ
jgi:hypothetical protein